MLLSRFALRAMVCLSVAAGVSGVVSGQGTYTTNGSEYAIAGTLPSDQIHPSLALNTTGGFLVWQDNVTDGDGQGISALHLDSSFSASLASFRVNATAAGDQENAQASLLSGGGAAFAWQGGPVGYQHIYARFLSSSNTWLSQTDLQVNSSGSANQVNPAIATLANGNVIVVYSSFNQISSNSLQDVYGQLLSPTGQKIGSEFLINQFTAFNQRTPSVAALSGGGFVVAWVSEQERSSVTETANPIPIASIVPPSVDIYARLYGADGAATGNEFLVNVGTNACANPKVAAGNNGGFVIAWSEKNSIIQQYSWDISARPFTSAGVGGNVVTVNTYRYGDQYAPQISAIGGDFLVVWTSLAQDGSREGVFGQFLHGDGTPNGSEFRVNTTTASQQMQPAVAADGYGRFLVTWTSFTGGVGSFDLYAQRYVNVAEPLLPMNAPFVYAPFVVSNGLYQPELVVSWPAQVGLPIDHYEVYMDGALTPTVTPSSNTWVVTGLAANSTHSFQVAYVTPDQRHSPLSPSATGTTWMGYSWYGTIPFEWMSTAFGYDTSKWPLPTAQIVPGGPTLLQIFLTGANPNDPSTWLRTQLVDSPQGHFLTWNPEPGRVYQVQMSSDLHSWSNFGSARFAAGNVDSLYVGLGSVAYYRVLLLR